MSILYDPDMPDRAFADWLVYCFDREVTDPAWYWDSHASWRGMAAMTVRHLTRLFDAPDVALSAYSDAQVDQGLWYITSNVCSDHMFALVDDSVPLAERVACILSIESLYAKCFAARCSEHLSHVGASDATSPLNRACYMFWDLMPLIPVPEDPERDALGKAVLHVLEAALRLPSIACQESALHGLGHWEWGYPDAVRAIVARYLERAQPPVALRDYAESAAEGNVL